VCSDLQQVGQQKRERNMLAESLWSMPVASSGLLIAVIVLMTVGLGLGVFVYHMWKQKHEGTLKTVVETAGRARKHTEKCVTANV